MNTSQASFARVIASDFHCKPSFVDKGVFDLSADIRTLLAIAGADPKTDFATRQGELMNRYGYGEKPQNEKPFAYSNGAAIIPIHGTLINRYSGSWSFMTGYNFIRSQLNFALGDDDVNLIIFDVNSGGGTAAGCGELSDEIFASRKVKPSLAVVDSSCYSAAYFLASAATKVIAAPSSGVGSIGCISMHVDYSKMLKKEGVQVTFIIFGDNKVDGNPYQPLSDRAKTTIQEAVDYHGNLLVTAVARNRGLSEDDIRNTEAACFNPDKALELGLIDAVVTPDKAVSSFYDAEEDDDIMDTKDGKPVAAPAANAAPGLTAEQVQQMIADAAATGAANGAKMAADAAAAAVKADRERTTAILGCEEAKTRPALAQKLLAMDISADAAKEILSTAQPETKAVRPDGRSQFQAAMDAGRHPNVGADTEAEGGEATPTVVADRMMGLLTTATGLKPREKMDMSTVSVLGEA